MEIFYNLYDTFLNRLSMLNFGIYLKIANQVRVFSIVSDFTPSVTLKRVQIAKYPQKKSPLL